MGASEAIRDIGEEEQELIYDDALITASGQDISGVILDE